ncbi:MAG: hypothetical protein A2293_03240 [Elusimicrobia bacterium RIFOXYB2_FULL_49_7]|nr:MAG: hypothetical protein A2293_03240 [Elusimicrobia bacterium RIFOXYB2_FULL_49_7]
MPRPFKCRRIGCIPDHLYFKPKGIPLIELAEVTLSMDELEALRLSHVESLYQEGAALRMNVSRQTFGNILDSAHRKVSDFLVNAKALRIEGGVITVQQKSGGASMRVSCRKKDKKRMIKHENLYSGRKK